MNSFQGCCIKKIRIENRTDTGRMIRRLSVYGRPSDAENLPPINGENNFTITVFNQQRMEDQNGENQAE